MIGALPIVQTESADTRLKTEPAVEPLPSEKGTGEGDDLPIFPSKNIEKIKNSLKPALDAVQNKEYQKALQETDKLLAILPKGPETEVASFLKGELYLKLSGDGNEDDLQSALSAFQEAMILYPDSENSARALWKMGIISSRLSLYYESIANYKRVISKFPNSPYAPKAALGIAQTYQAWEKWKEAITAYSKIKPAEFSPEDRPVAVLGLAETLYHSGDYPHAYQIYRHGWKIYSTYFSRQAVTLFHYGDSAYQIAHPQEAKEIFFRFYNVFPRDPMTLMVLSRLVNIFYQEEDGKEVTQINEIIQTLYPGPLGNRITDLINEIEEIKTKNCLRISKNRGVKSFFIQKCSEGDPKQIHPPHDEVNEIGGMVDGLLQEPPQTIMVQQFLFQEAEQFRRLNYPLMTFEIENRLLPLVTTSSLQREVMISFNQAAGEAINKEYQSGNYLKIVELYFNTPDTFTGKILLGPTGLQIAASLTRNGFYAQALPIYETSLNGLSPNQVEEAHYLYARTLAEKGDTENARKKMESFLKKYPRSIYRQDILEKMGNLFYKKKNYNLAVEKYKLWLFLYPSSPDVRRISLKLATAYEHLAQHKEAIPLYLQLLKKDPADPSLHLKLADDYFQLKEYKEAVSSYQKSLKEKMDNASTDWARFRVAKCFEALRQKNKGRELFAELAKNSEDPIIKTLAIERNGGKN